MGTLLSRQEKPQPHLFVTYLLEAYSVQIPHNTTGQGPAMASVAWVTMRGKAGRGLTDPILKGYVTWENGEPRGDVSGITIRALG